MTAGDRIIFFKKNKRGGPFIRDLTFEKRKVHSVYHGTESLSFLGPKIWRLVPVELKQSEILYSFKLKIRNWVPFECQCRICKTYIQQVGLL